MDTHVRWADRIVLLFSVISVGTAILLFISRGGLTTIADSGQNLTWYFVRGSGITAYVLLTLSTIWGLVLSSRAVKDWSPGVLSMLMHSTLAWLSVIFSVIHAELLLFDKYFTYTLLDLFIPFRGPYRPVPVGLGTVSFWIMLIVTLSFSFKKNLGHPRWRLIHLTSYLGFVLATAHGFLAGADADRLGFQVVILISVCSTLVFLGYRLGNNKKAAKSSERRSAPRSEAEAASDG